MLSFLKSGQNSAPSWGARLKAGLARTRKVLNTDLADLFAGGAVDDAFFDELETTLLLADVGVAATEYLIGELRNAVRREGLRERHELKRELHAALVNLLKPIAVPLEVGSHQPFIVMLAGVNGAGKTTSIGKLAKYYQQQGKSILLAAGDTFRAAAREQLQVWGERNNVAVIAQQSGDAAAVIFDAITAAKARGIDVVLCDTAGRLPTQLHLMEEISKVKRVIAKAAPGAPHEVLLVLDANTGQNALNQVKAFDDALGVTGLVLTKLDGTAKGGVVVALAEKFGLPVHFVGVGESAEDLRPFSARGFARGLMGLEA